MTDRQTRIEVGRGLEGVLTDLRASVVLKEIVRPHLTEDDVEGAARAGVDAILSVLDGEELGVERSRSSSSSAEYASLADMSMGLRVTVAGMFFAFLALLSFFALVFGGAPQVWIFLLAGNPLSLGVGFFVGVAQPFWIAYVAIFVLLALFLQFVPGGQRWRQRMKKSMVTGSGSSGGGSSRSTYDSGGGSSSSDFDGGGGDFGGGGASDEY